MTRVMPFPLPVLLLLAACGGDTTSDGVDSGIAADKQGKQLTPDEQTRLCEAAIGYLDQENGPDVKATDCRVNAVLNASLLAESPAECETRFDECIAEPEDASEECAFGPLKWDACEATIAEIEACYTEWMDANAALSRMLTCDKVAEYAERWPGQDIKLGPACKAANEACPNLVPDPQAASMTP